VDLKQVENFLYREAACLDRPDLDRWMKLYTEDGTYWMPAAENQPDAVNHVSHMFDDRVMMEIRKRNFVHPRAASKDAAVRCSHIIGNVQLQDRSDNGELRVSSNFQVVMWYRDEQRLYAGTYEHHLVRHSDDFLIHHKKVELINPETAHKSIIIYL
jgi:benzoate/toluate 1,2-dioxygenase beta subunit